MERKALGFKTTEISEKKKIFKLDNLLANMDFSFIITDSNTGAGKIVLEINFEQGLSLIDAIEVKDKSNEEGFVLCDKHNDKKVVGALTESFIKFEDIYDSSTLNFTIKLAGKAGGTVGGEKAGGTVNDDFDNFIWK